MLAVLWRHPGVLARVAVAALAAEVVSRLLKEWIGRVRPPLRHPDPEPLMHVPDSSSFPSGHATVGFACAAVLARAAPRLALPLYALAALVAWSRVHVGVHYPLDVVAGAALGWLIGHVIREGLPSLARRWQSGQARGARDSTH